MCPSRITFALAVAATACTTTATPAGPRFTADDERAIRALDSVFVAAWLRDDTTAVMNTLAPGVVLMPAGQSVLTTPDAIRAFWWPSDGSHTRILTFDRAIDELGGKATSPGCAVPTRSRSRTRKAERPSPSPVGPCRWPSSSVRPTGRGGSVA
jgi:hypothetical protein